MAKKLEAIIIDLDGTLAKIEHRLHHLMGEKKDWKSFYASMADDAFNENVRSFVIACRDKIPLFVTGRPMEYFEVTHKWLNTLFEGTGIDTKNNLFMRNDGDYRADIIVKKEIYEEFILPCYDVRLVLEDRDQVVDMWRSLGIECWQVAKGTY